MFLFIIKLLILDYVSPFELKIVYVGEIDEDKVSMS